MSLMFQSALAFNQSLEVWNTTNVRHMNGMFFNALDFNQPLNDWDTTNVQFMDSMFTNAAFNQPLNDWNTTNVQSMVAMFAGAVAFNQPLDDWDTTNVQSMSGMFRNATAFNQDILSWSTLANPDAGRMFENAGAWLDKFRRIDGGTSTDGPPNLWDFPPLPSGEAFRAAVTACLVVSPEDGECPGSVYGPMPEWDTSQTTDMKQAFRGQRTFNGVASSTFDSDS